MNDKPDTTRARFVVFCLEAYKKHERLTGKVAADRFLKYGVVQYLQDGYEVLHSLGENALVEDVVDFIRRREGA